MARILIIDDERDVCEVLQECLQYEGYEADMCHTGSEALQRTKEIKYDIAIIDLRLEGQVTGIDVIRKMVKQEGRPRILATSGTPRALIRSIFQQEGILGFVEEVLEKPGDLNPDKIAEVVKKVLQSSPP